MFGELNVVVPDDLDAVAPGIAEVKEMGIDLRYAGSVEGAPSCLLVIDDEPEMAASICTLAPPLGTTSDTGCPIPSDIMSRDTN